MRGDRHRAELLQVKSEKTEAENGEVIIISNFRLFRRTFFTFANAGQWQQAATRPAFFKPSLFGFFLFLGRGFTVFFR